MRGETDLRTHYPDTERHYIIQSYICDTLSVQGGVQEISDLLAANPPSAKHFFPISFNDV